MTADTRLAVISETDGVELRPVVTDTEPRCWRCNHMLALYLSRPWSLKCPKCRAQNQSANGN